MNAHGESAEATSAGVEIFCDATYTGLLMHIDAQLQGAERRRPTGQSEGSQ